jgi:hypothetical protein
VRGVLENKVRGGVTVNNLAQCVVGGIVRVILLAFAVCCTGNEATSSHPRVADVGFTEVAVARLKVDTHLALAIASAAGALIAKRLIRKAETICLSLAGAEPLYLPLAGRGATVGAVALLRCFYDAVPTTRTLPFAAGVATRAAVALFR